MSRRVQSGLAAASAALRLPALRRSGLAFLIGGLGFFLLGTAPTRLPPAATTAPNWSLPALDAAAPITAWPAPVWASEPVPASVVALAAPQPRLLGILRAGGVRLALFQMYDGSRVRAAEGERLPDGSEVTAIEPTRAAWRDTKGGTHEARLLVARTP